MQTPVPGKEPIRVGSNNITKDLLVYEGDVCWDTRDFLEAHKAIKSSGFYNYEFCKIPIPTRIRYDRIREALGENCTVKDEKMLRLVKYGMPVGCDPSYGVKRKQKNHHSAVSFKNDISKYLKDNAKSQAILGPFKVSPISNLCYSPLMTVPKEEVKRRVVVDFSFPPGKSINDGILKETYLDFVVDYSLPSVSSMICRINELGPGCLLYKKDLKGAYRQFRVDPGDFIFTGLEWLKEIFIDTMLAMGLRSSAFCCQSVTEMVAKIARIESHVLVYLDDFGGAEYPEAAADAYNNLGNVIKFCGLQEAKEKAVPPSTRMDWLGITLDTVEWTMALKSSKLSELLDLLPRLLKLRRVSKRLLQKVLGSLVWA